MTTPIRRRPIAGAAGIGVNHAPIIIDDDPDPSGPASADEFAIATAAALPAACVTHPPRWIRSTAAGAA